MYDLKTAKIKSSWVLPCGLLENTCSLRSSGKNGWVVCNNGCFNVIKTQARKFTETKTALTLLPLRKTSPPGYSLACQAKQLPKLPLLNTLKIPFLDSKYKLKNVIIKTWKYRSRQFLKAIIKIFFVSTHIYMLLHQFVFISCINSLWVLTCDSHFQSLNYLFFYINLTNIHCTN